MARDRLAGENLAVLQPDPARLGVDAETIPIRDATGVGAGHGDEAEIERIAIEDAGEGGGHDGGDPESLQGLGRLFPGGAHAKISAADENVARRHRAGEIGSHGFEAVSGQFLYRQGHIGAGCQGVGVDIVAHHPGPPHPVGPIPAGHAATSRGSAIRPAMAEAATV